MESLSSKQVSDGPIRTITHTRTFLKNSQSMKLASRDFLISFLYSTPSGHPSDLAYEIRPPQAELTPLRDGHGCGECHSPQWHSPQQAFFSGSACNRGFNCKARSANRRIRALPCFFLQSSNFAEKTIRRGTRTNSID